MLSDALEQAKQSVLHNNGEAQTYAAIAQAEALERIAEVLESLDAYGLAVKAAV